MTEKGELYIVATPIGNLSDISQRALSVLGESDVIICEDTRVTQKLLKHYGIGGKIISFNAHASDSKISQIIQMLEEGKKLSLVSDAGTPTISDPGSYLVQEVYRLVPDVKVFAVPGPSAVVAALSVSGIPASEFTFFGFIPHKKGRNTLFEEVRVSKRPAVMYESPHRIMKTLSSFADILEENRLVIVVREITKIYEETVRGSAKQVLEYFESNQDKQRGEFVVIVGN